MNGSEDASIEAKLDRIEELLRALLAAMIKMNIRLDAVCGRELE